MAAITSSLVIRYAIMGMVLAGAFFTVKAQESTITQNLHYRRIQEIAEYTSNELTEGINKVQTHNKTLRKTMHYPQIEEGYKVRLHCNGEKVTIEVEPNIPIPNYQLETKLNCNQVNATGQTFPGRRCLTITKESPTQIKAVLEGDCGT